MKLPFVSRRSYEELEEVYNILEIDYYKLNDKCDNMLKELYESNDKISEYSAKIDTLEKDRISLDKTIASFYSKNDELKKELKRIKTICTRNGISYIKKEDK